MGDIRSEGYAYDIYPTYPYSFRGPLCYIKRHRDDINGGDILFFVLSIIDHSLVLKPKYLKKVLLSDKINMKFYSLFRKFSYYHQELLQLHLLTMDSFTRSLLSLFPQR